jgi:hypothetical protein
MRQPYRPVVFTVGCTGLLVILSSSAFQAQTRTLSSCEVQGAVLKLAHQAVIPVGLETNCADQNAVPPIVPSDYEEPAPDVRAALNRIVSDAPDYEWRDMHGLFVVPPLAAWSDRRHFLTGQVNAFMATGDLNEAMAALSEPMEPRFFRIGIDAPTRRNDVRQDRLLLGARTTPAKPAYMTSFPGGSLLEALNTLVRGQRAGGWVVSYCGPHPALETAIVTVAVFDEQIGRTTNVALWHDNRHVNPRLPASR